jgi:hypothetical protein
VSVARGVGVGVGRVALRSELSDGVINTPRARSCRLARERAKVVACVKIVGAKIHASGPKKKAEDIPPPPRHAEVVETFNTLASNLAELASVSTYVWPCHGVHGSQFCVTTDPLQSAPAQLARAQRAKAVQEEINNMGP